MTEIKKKYKNKNYYNDKIRTQSRLIKELEQERKDLESIVCDLTWEYNSSLSLTSDPSHFLEKFPLESLRDFFDFSAGKEMRYNLDLLDERIEIKKCHTESLEDLQVINDLLRERKIDLLLAKIDYTLEKHK